MNEIRKLINIETKQASANGTGTSAAQTATCTYMLPLAEGLDNSDRVGVSIKTQSMRCKFWVKMNGSATNTIVRCLIVRDWNNTGAAPTSGDILNIPGAGQACTAQYNFINTQKPRFAILYDEVVLLNTASNMAAFLEFDCQLGQHAHFRGTTSAVTSAAEGSLWFMLVSNEATNTPTYDYDTRVFFTDD